MRFLSINDFFFKILQSQYRGHFLIAETFFKNFWCLLWHSLKSGPGTRDPETQDPEAQAPKTRDPGIRDSGTLELGTLRLWNWDPGTWDLRPWDMGS